MNTDTTLIYNQIKKQNGEGVAKVIREGVLLDVPDIVHILEFAGNNPNEVEQLVPVIQEVYKNQSESQYHTDKNPLELLSDAGYDAFVVKNATQKDSIKKYYRPGEELCTFRDSTRHEKYYIIHAIKRGADKIKPSNNPQREDEYGTSVISIQIAKSGGFISIKNRYNHTVDNPDATFDNDPDNIIPGLSNSLKKYFNVDFNTAKTPLPRNFRMVNDQLVRYNYELNNVYFGSDYYFSGSTITKLNKDYEIMLDVFILDIRTGKLRDVADMQETNFSFNIMPYQQNLFDILGRTFTDFWMKKNKKIRIQINPNNKQERMIYVDDIHVVSVEQGIITELNLLDTEAIGDKFMSWNKKLRKISAPNLMYIGNYCLENNLELKEIYFPVLQKIGDSFLRHNEKLTKFSAPELEEMGDYCFVFNRALKELYAPKLKKIGAYSSNFKMLRAVIRLKQKGMNSEQIEEMFKTDKIYEYYD